MSALFSSERIIQHRFQGQHVLVTGASSGIGRSIAVQLAKSGAVLTLVARGVARLEAAAEDVRACRQSADVRRGSSKSGVLAAPCDCSNYDEVDRLVELAEREHGPIHVLINCAGGAVGTYFGDMTAEVAETQMKGNYFSQLYPTRAVFSRMKERGAGGHIVLTSSMAGLLGVFGMAAYSPAKFAVRGLAECVYYEGRPHDISVTTCYPPDTDTDGYANEQKTMPLETIEISANAGLYSPETVAERLLVGVARKQFRVMTGLDGKMLGIATAGLSPGATLVEIILLPLMRAISGLFVRDFNKTIDRIGNARTTTGLEPQEDDS